MPNVVLLIIGNIPIAKESGHPQYQQKLLLKKKTNKFAYFVRIINKHTYKTQHRNKNFIHFSFCSLNRCTVEYGTVMKPNDP